MDFDEKCCECALNDIFGFEPRVARALMDNLGSAKAVFDMSTEEKDMLLGPFSKYKGLLTIATVEKCADRLSELEKGLYRFIGIGDEDYPVLLKECEDAPVGLYMKCVSPPSEVFGRKDYISVVGTRDLSSYGEQWCREFVTELGNCPGGAPTVVSGLALGVDITAHTAALDSGIPTIAVMATGIDSVYPFRHGYQASRIAESPCSALVTDYPPGTSPVAANFLRRNRIIAGLSRSTILVESKIRGGGMVTASMVSSYGRDLYALPGRCEDIRSRGCNHLISAKLADAIEDIPSLIRSLGLEFGGQRAKRDPLRMAKEEYSKAGNNLKRVEDLTSVLSLIKNRRGISIPELQEETGFSYEYVTRLVMMLETDGFVEVDLLQRCSMCGK
ncbi:MAG: DNA-protecting protein DprA [Bacteroidales bacterium]|nr:DNA-protecting protein DprA [Bacteroidales bacterium]